MTYRWSARAWVQNQATKEYGEGIEVHREAPTLQAAQAILHQEAFESLRDQCQSVDDEIVFDYLALPCFNVPDAEGCY